MYDNKTYLQITIADKIKGCVKKYVLTFGRVCFEQFSLSNFFNYSHNSLLMASINKILYESISEFYQKSGTVTKTATHPMVEMGQLEANRDMFLVHVTNDEKLYFTN